MYQTETSQCQALDPTTRLAAFPRLQIFRDLLAALRRLDLDVGDILEIIRQASALFANFTPEGLLAFIELVLAKIQPAELRTVRGLHVVPTSGMLEEHDYAVQHVLGALFRLAA